MMASSLAPALDSHSARNRHQLANPPVSRIVSHPGQRFVVCTHRIGSVAYGTMGFQHSPLDLSACTSYAKFVTGVPVIGIGVPKALGGQPPSLSGNRHFFRPWFGFSPMGGPNGEPKGSPVPSGRYANPFGSLTLDWRRGRAVTKPFTRSLTMDTHAPGASAPVLATQPAIFLFHDTEVRTIDRNGQVWFVAGDVAKALGYADAVQMTRVLDDDEAALHTMQIRSENGTIQTREVTILSESGLYHALLKSRKPEARPFRRWVTQEVLPAIRRGAQPRPKNNRLLLAWDADGQWHSQSLPANVCVIDPDDREQLACFLREYVPADHLSEVLAIAAQRLLKNRHHPLSNA